MRVLTIVGARPQFIKAAPVSAAFLEHGIEEILVHTGQHYDPNMSDVFFKELNIPSPARALGVGSGSHGEQTGAMLQKLERAIMEERPDAVLVYGDTNSTLAGALASAKLHVPVAHVEAGLRSFNRRMPEEQNRIVTDHLSDWLLAPTDLAVRNLGHEGIPAARVHKVGDVMFDAALRSAGKAERTSQVLDQLGLVKGGYILATIHRAENTDDPSRLSAIINGLQSVALDIPVVLPLHPRTRKALHNLNLMQDLSVNLRITDPVGYLDMVRLEQCAALIATDSGGVQKEAYFFRIPCVTLRTETEWTELVELGWNKLQTPESAEAVALAIRSTLGSLGREGLPYGDGEASRKIARVLLEA